jgi:hypothetical protein
MLEGLRLIMASSLILSEKRRLQRQELIYYLKVLDLLSNNELGRLIDIHTMGLLLMGNRPLETGQDFFIAVELPKGLQEQGVVRLELKAKCVWQRPSETRPFLEHGMMFLNPNEEARKTIALLIDLFAMPSGSFLS